jgi:hypothetical protein
VDQGINLKGCLYFIGKGNLKFSLSKWRVTSKIALHVTYHVYHLNDIENYNLSETKEHTWWKDRTISLMKHWCFEYIETVMTSQHIGINDNLEDNKKAVVEKCEKLTI